MSRRLARRRMGRGLPRIDFGSTPVGCKSRGRSLGVGSVFKERASLPVCSFVYYIVRWPFSIAYRGKSAERLRLRNFSASPRLCERFHREGVSRRGAEAQRDRFGALFSARSFISSTRSFLNFAALLASTVRGLYDSTQGSSLMGSLCAGADRLARPKTTRNTA
jgi:hypothetical protein